MSLEFFPTETLEQAQLTVVRHVIHPEVLLEEVVLDAILLAHEWLEPPFFTSTTLVCPSRSVHASDSARHLATATNK